MSIDDKIKNFGDDKCVTPIVRVSHDNSRAKCLDCDGSKENGKGCPYYLSKKEYVREPPHLPVY